MNELELIIAISIFICGVVWVIYDAILTFKIMPGIDEKNQHIPLLRANTRFAKVSRSGVYMLACALPGLFKQNRRKYAFYATERERLLYLIDGYMGILVILGVICLLIINWILDHRIYWW